MTKIAKTYLATIEVPGGKRKNPEVMRIILGNEHTQIDFGYKAERMYINGGWIRIAAETHLVVHGLEKRFMLREAQHIPIAPEQHYFESYKDWRVFTLFFEPIPIKDCVIDIIESEQPNTNDFNYYGIKLKDVTATEIIKL